jgi:hypothetical protein
MNTLLCSTALVLAFPVLSAFLDGSARIRPLRLPRSPFVAGKHNSHFSHLQSTTDGFNTRPEEGLRSVHIIKENDVLDLLREKLGLCGDESIDMFVVNLASTRTVDELGEWFALFEDRLGLNKADLNRMFMKYSTFLSFGVECIEDKLDWLQERLALDDEGLSKLVYRYPRVFSLAIEGNLEPTLDWLQERLALDDEGLRKLVQREPTLLEFSIERNLEPKLTFF